MSASAASVSSLTPRGARAAKRKRPHAVATRRSRRVRQRRGDTTAPAPPPAPRRTRSSTRRTRSSTRKARGSTRTPAPSAPRTRGKTRSSSRKTAATGRRTRPSTRASAARAPASAAASAGHPVRAKTHPATPAAERAVAAGASPASDVAITAADEPRAQPSTGDGGSEGSSGHGQPQSPGASERGERYPLAGTMVEALMMSGVGAGRVLVGADVNDVALYQLLSEQAVTVAEMDMRLVQPLQVVVAVVNQFARVPGLQRFVAPLLAGIDDSAAANAVDWRAVMSCLPHSAVPIVLRPHARRLRDVHGHTQLRWAMDTDNEHLAVECVSSEHGAWLCEQMVETDLAWLREQLVEANRAPTGGDAASDGAAGRSAAADVRGSSGAGAHGDGAGAASSTAGGRLRPRVRRGETMLMHALRCRKFRLAETMLDVFGAAGCRVGHVAPGGRTALMVAIESGTETVALMLLRRFGAACKPAAVDDTRQSALVQAIRANMERVAVALARLGPDACAMGQPGADGCTPLTLCVMRDMPALLAQLLQNPAEAVRPDAKTFDTGCFALVAALLRGRSPAALRLLDAYGFDACCAGDAYNHARGEAPATALRMAMANRMNDVAMKLLELGGAAAVTGALGPRDGHEPPLLRLAIAGRMSAVAARLLDLAPAGDLDLGHTGGGGTTMLMLAIERRMAGVAARMLTAGGSARCRARNRDERGHTALSLAKRANMTALARRLRRMRVPDRDTGRDSAGDDEDSDGDVSLTAFHRRLMATITFRHLLSL